VNIREKLAYCQQNLKAPKGKKNDFGGYAYRSCEDILEALKPVLNKVGAIVTLSDEVVAVGERVYVKVTATFADVESDDVIETTAFAREAPIKKGMDDSQITGASSSYSRKYCLNGLLGIDGTKDADTMDNTAPKATQAEVDQLIDHANKKQWTAQASIQRLEQRFTVSPEQKKIIKDEVKG
jgi:hypothetical protein